MIFDSMPIKLNNADGSDPATQAAAWAGGHVKSKYPILRLRAMKQPGNTTGIRTDANSRDDAEELQSGIVRSGEARRG